MWQEMTKPVPTEHLGKRGRWLLLRWLQSPAIFFFFFFGLGISDQEVFHMQFCYNLNLKNRSEKCRESAEISKSLGRTTHFMFS